MISNRPKTGKREGRPSLSSRQQKWLPKATNKWQQGWTWSQISWLLVCSLATRQAVTLLSHIPVAYHGQTSSCTLLGERAMYAKWPPNAEGAKRPKNQRPRQVQLVGLKKVFNRELREQSQAAAEPMVARTFDHPYPTPICVSWFKAVRICGWSGIRAGRLGCRGDGRENSWESGINPGEGEGSWLT